jgi:FKBP-type peptidyl-prolyl cis-trans isomerase SlyD
MDEETLTVDGNNPLCGREVVFALEIVAVREPTDEEMRAGGAIGAQAAIDSSLMRPV